MVRGHCPKVGQRFAVGWVNFSALGTQLLTELKTTHLRSPRTHLVQMGLKLKTARNIIDGSFRAMIREARADDLLSADPFAALKWKRTAPPPPEPFTAEERDQILGWFFNRCRAYYPFVAALFHTGLRPSEAAALRWGDVDVAAGTLSVARSRYLGAEGAPKTARSARTIRLLPYVREILAELKPLHADADAYVFTNARTGGPINQSEWAREFWGRPLRALGIRPRKFYATRHTFTSVALTAGVNIKFLAEYCGTSVAMIERSYGRFLQPEGFDPLQALTTAERPALSTPHVASARAKPSTFSRGFTVRAEKPLPNIVVPTGLEPVLPT